MLVAILGNLGSGKTLLSVINAYYSNLPIVSNFFIDFSNREIESFDLDRFLRADYQNCIILLDEAYNYLESRISGSELNRVMSYILFQFRKKNVTMYFTAQLFSTIDRRYRELCDMIIVAKSRDPTKKENFSYTITNFLITKKFVLDYEKASEFFTMYDTKEVILNHNPKLEFNLKSDTDKMSEITMIAEEVNQFYEKKNTLTRNMVKLYFTTHKLPSFLITEVYTQAKLLRDEKKEQKGKKIKKKKD
ncbi:MAG: AAA family ATPase [Candidatus Thorarchaeota archaeon]